MKTAKKEKVLLKDNVVKKLFTNGSKASKEYLTKIIRYTLDIPLEEVKDNFELIHPEIALNNHMVNSETDLVYENRTSYITIEFNYK